MTIEISKPELHLKSITYTEAKLYCFTLGNGWRLPIHPELVYNKQLWGSWYTDAPIEEDFVGQTETRNCIPVRNPNPCEPR